ncbi:hypothetical protein SARC_11855, partial [Sphaeroforma arctica JP610]
TVAKDGLTRCDHASEMADRKRFQGKTRASSLVTDAMKAHISLMSGLLNFGLHNYMRGAMNLRTSWKGFAEISKRKFTDENDSDLMLARTMGYTGVSQFLFFMSVLPSSALFIAKLAGFEANKVEGLRMANSVMDTTNDLMSKRQSCMLLILEALMRASNEFDPEHKKAQEEAVRVHDIMAEHGGGDLTFIKWIGTQVWRRTGRIEDAAIALDQVVEKAKKIENGPNLVFRVRFDQATMHFIEQDYARAKDFMLPLIDKNSTYTSKTMTCVLIGACCANLGLDNQAQNAYKMVSDVGSGGRMDENLKLKVKTLMRRKCQKLVGIELTYVLGFYKILSLADVEKCLAQLDDFEKEIEGHRTVVDEVKKTSKHMLLVDEEMATCYLLKGAYLQRLQRSKEAVVYLKKAINVSNELAKELRKRKRIELYDNYHMPCAHFELAGIALSVGDAKNGKAHLDRVMKYSGYTFQSGMEFRVKLIHKHSMLDDKPRPSATLTEGSDNASTPA